MFLQQVSQPVIRHGTLHSVAFDLPSPSAGISAPVLSLKRTSAAAVMMVQSIYRIVKEKDTVDRIHSRQISRVDEE